MNLIQDKLDVRQKKRSNIFNWRGQFTPEFVEYILDALNLRPGALVADPFAGSGTVLMESAMKGFSSAGFEINPAAYQMASFYKYSALDLARRHELLFQIKKELAPIASKLNGQAVYKNSKDYRTSYQGLIEISKEIHDIGNREFLPFLMNLLFLSEKDKKLTVKESLRGSFDSLGKYLLKLPFCDSEIKVFNSDARTVSRYFQNEIDLILTSPPYINVFNYHQNYRAVTEAFKYDLLDVSRSEFGSNRKNRGNRLLTVVQYCLDMESSIDCFWHSLKDGGRLVMVVGRESNVRKSPFYNGEIVFQLISGMGGYEIKGREERSFSNKFGQRIFEDILICEKTGSVPPSPENALAIAENHLKKAEKVAPQEVKCDFKEAYLKLSDVKPSPIFE